MRTRNGLAISELISARRFECRPDQARTGDGPAASVVAIGRRRNAVAFAADRRHGTGFSPGNPRQALRSLHTGCPERETGASGVAIAISLWRLEILPAKLTRPIRESAVFGRIDAAAHLL